VQAFEPTPTHEAIAGALNDTAPTSLAELASAAGVSTRTVQRVISDPAALQWIIAQASQLAEARLGAVHLRIFQQAMTSRSPGWAKLFMERFDADYKKQKVAERGGAHQFNFLGDMETSELSGWISRKLQALQGIAGLPTAPKGEVRGDVRSSDEDDGDSMGD